MLFEFATFLRLISRIFPAKERKYLLYGFKFFSESKIFPPQNFYCLLNVIKCFVWIFSYFQALSRLFIEDFLKNINKHLRNDTAPIVISLILLEGCYFVENWKMIS
jgi:hypothetical protein